MDNREPMGRRRETHLEGESDVVHEAELIHRNITLENSSDMEEEIGRWNATGFHEPEDSHLIDQLQDIHGMARNLAKRLGINWKKTHMRRENLTRMVFLSQTTKSKGGAAFKWARTEVLQKDENIWQKAETGEEAGMLDKLLNKMEKSDQQVVGKPNLGTYDRNPGEGF